MKLLDFLQAMFIYVNQRIVLFHTHGDEMDMDECLSRTFFFHDAALYSFVFPFHCLLDIRKNKRVYLYDIVLSLGIFFSLPFLEFFSSMSQYFCLSDIVRIHHVFSLLVYIIFPFSSDLSLFYRFMYGYL
jgi:hypothetical protein